MNVVYGQFREFNEAILNELIENLVHESKTIEYKSALPGNSSSERKEFLADVSSFANTSGGYIFFGLDEEDGVPTKATGFTELSFDELKLRLESILNSSIDPRIPDIHFSRINLKNNADVIVMSVPKSWAAPHMITLENWSRFYRRNNSGKYIMDTGELKADFLNAVSIPTRVREARSIRIAKISAGTDPIKLYDGSRLVMHFIPLESYVHEVTIPTAMLDDLGAKFQLLEFQYGHGRANLDGHLIRGAARSDESCYSYVQLYRNGVIEAVSTFAAQVHTAHQNFSVNSIPKSVDYKWVNSDTLKSAVEKMLAQVCAYYQNLTIGAPVFVFISLIGVEGAMLLRSKHHIWDDSDNHLRTFDRDLLLFPEIVLTSLEVNPHSVLQDTFELLWQASGYRTGEGPARH